MIAPNDEALSLPSRCSSTANVDARRARTDGESGEVIEVRLTELRAVRHAHVLASGSITNSGGSVLFLLDLLRSVQLLTLCTNDIAAAPDFPYSARECTTISAERCGKATKHLH